MDASTLDATISAWLEEDGLDLTSEATVSSSSKVEAQFLAKRSGTVAGLDVVARVFHIMDPTVEVQWSIKDGATVQVGDIFGSVRGPVRSILKAERVALNILQRMSGIATQTRHMADLASAGSSGACKVLDTRKTAPGLRYFDKLAVQLGGGQNHRMSLHDMVMIKDNHVSAAGGLGAAVQRAKAHLTQQGLFGTVPIEVETRTLDEVKQALAFKNDIDRIMLDNMAVVRSDGSLDTTMLREAVALVGGAVPTEASGNITLATIEAVASTGVTFASCGSLTHSVVALDISLKIKP